MTVGDVGCALPAIAWGVGRVLVGRAIVVYGLLGIPARLLHTRAGAPADPRCPGCTCSSGPASVARLPSRSRSRYPDFPQRGLVQGIVFGIVLFTLVVQGTHRRVGRPTLGSANAEAAAEAA